MSLRLRLIVSCILIVIVCLGVTAMSVSVVLQRSRNQLALARLNDITRPISVQIKSLLHGTTNLTELWANAQEQSQTNQVWILFVDNQGDLLKAIIPDGNPGQSFTVAVGLPHNLPQAAQGVFSTSGGDKYIYSAYPLGKSPLGPSLRADTLVLCQPQKGRADVLASLIRPLFLSGLVALTVSLIIALLIAQSIYRPIRHLSRAAENLAQGKYDQAVPVTGPPEIRELANNFNSMTVKIKESQLHLRHFVADVSHQLKSPLTSIQGFAQAMLDGNAADIETRNKAAGIIVDESKRMIRQVNELLELSKMQAGQVKIDRQTLNIQEIITQCQDIFALRLQEKQLTVKNEFNYSGAISGDADRLEDVFSNLLDNAIKNSPPQGLIQVKTTLDQNHNLKIQVSDEGPGIPPEQIPFIFDRFQPSSGLRSGFGLGLAIAREIILAHGGRITVESNPGEGAQFIIFLPLNSPASAPPPSAQPNSRPPE
jgi:signal transduction histidine kinase